MVLIGEAASRKAVTTKKTNVRCKFSINSPLGKKIDRKLLNLQNKQMTPGQLFDKCIEFKEFGLTKAQFRGAVNCIRARHRIVVVKYERGKFKNIVQFFKQFTYQ